MKSIFEYDNYRDYLRDFYGYEKTRNKKFSLRYFSRLAGFKSQSVLSLVIEGKSNIAFHSIEKFIKALKLNKNEAQFFKNLVLFNQAKNAGEKQEFAEQIIKSRGYKKTHPLCESEYAFFSTWYYVLIWELVEIPGFKEDYDWIAKKLNPPIKPSEARRAVDELLRLGLLDRDGNGELIQTKAFVATPDEVISSAAAQYHLEMLSRAGESIKRVPREKRDISAQTFGVSEETAKRIKEMIQKFRNDIMEVVAQEKCPDSVYQLNFQLFPLVQLKDEESK